MTPELIEKLARAKSIAKQLNGDKVMTWLPTKTQGRIIELLQILYDAEEMAKREGEKK